MGVLSALQASAVSPRNRHARLAAVLTELGRCRPLSEEESGWLQDAVHDLSRGTRQRERWTPANETQLRDLLREGKRPPAIAPLIGRTEGAVWRRINRLGGIKGLLEDGGFCDQYARGCAREAH